jgi:hypothetical protein
MRKIFLTLLICLLIISCSSNEENTNEENAVEVSVPENLVGSWKFVGIYNYFDIDQVDEPYIENYDNGNILTFNSNNNFTDTGEINHNGTYKIYADSVLTRFFNATESTNSFSQNVKIVTLNDSILDFTCTNEDNIGTCPCEAYRYVKVN